MLTGLEPLKATEWLIKVAQKPERYKEIDFKQIFPALLFFLNNIDLTIKANAIRALDYFCRDADTAKKVPVEAVQSLEKLLVDLSPEIRGRAADTLGRIILPYASKARKVKIETVPVLVSLLQDSSEKADEIKRSAASALVVLAKDSSQAHYEAMIVSGGFRTIASLLESENTELKKSALRIMDYLTRNPENHALIFADIDTVQVLNPLLEKLSAGSDSEIAGRSRAILTVLPKAPVIIAEPAPQPPDDRQDDVVEVVATEAIAAVAPSAPTPTEVLPPKKSATLKIAVPLNTKYLEMLVPGIRECKTYCGRDEEDEEPKEFIAIVTEMLQRVTFQVLSELPEVSVEREEIPWQWNAGVFQYDLQWRPPVTGDAADHYVFVFAGRKLGAHISPVDVGLRPVLVVTEAEYSDIHSKIPEYCGVLVIKSLSVNGSPYDPMALVPRRLAGFIAAYHLGISHCFVTDDNIKSIHFAELGDKPFRGLVELMGDLASQAIETAMSFDKVRSARRPGDKFFCLNIAKLKTRFPTVPEAFNFMFPVPLERALLEDYFMQFVWEKVFPDEGFGIFPKNAVLLDRSAAQRSMFKKTSAAAANPLQKTIEWRSHVSPELLRLYRPEYQAALEDLGNSAGQTVEESRQRVTQYQRTDLYARNARARGVDTAGARDLSVLHPSVEESAAPSREGFFDYLSRLMTEHRESVGGLLRLREYQLDALQAFVEYKKVDSLVMLATGCGKTFLEMALLVLTRLYYGPQGPSILLIAPTQDLVEQAYQDFQTLKLESDRFGLKRIISVMSDVTRAVTLANFSRQSSAQKGGIVIMCDASFSKLVDDSAESAADSAASSVASFLQRSPLIVFDEAHLKQGTKAKTRRFCSEATLFSLTATPGEKEVPIFRFSRRDAVSSEPAVLPPAVVLTFKKNYSKKREEKCIEHIAVHLSTILLPDGRFLKESCGIIYVRSIAIANALAERLQKNGMAASAIHSEDDKNSKLALKRFKSGGLTEVLVVVDQLKIGFSSGRVAWVMCLTKSQYADDVVQRAGRAYRQGDHKVGLFIGFANCNIKGLGIDGPHLGRGCYDKEAEPHLHPAFKAQLATGLKSRPVTMAAASAAEYVTVDESKKRDEHPTVGDDVRPVKRYQPMPFLSATMSSAAESAVLPHGQSAMTVFPE